MGEPEATSGTGVEVILDGGAWRDVVGLDDNDMEAIYNLAFVQYEQGKYEDADKTFRLLCFYDHRSARFWLGLGSTKQRLRDFPAAIAAYSMMAEMGHEDPRAPLRAAECYLALGMIEEAASGLETALAWAGNAADADAIVRQVEVLYTAFQNLTDDAAEGGANSADTRTSASAG